MGIPLFPVKRGFPFWVRWCLTVPVVGGCGSLYADDGPTIAPLVSLEPPATTVRRQVDDHNVLRSRLMRRTKLGLGGELEVTLLAPILVYGMLTQGDETLSLSEGSDERQLIRSRWQAYFGAYDRIPFDVTWRFDQQFQASGRVLDPTTWQFTLKNDRGDAVMPLAVSVLSASRLPVDGFWRGQVRVWFPFREFNHHRSLLGGDVRWARLYFEHRAGDATVAWRLHSPF